MEMQQMKIGKLLLITAVILATFAGCAVSRQNDVDETNAAVATESAVSKDSREQNSSMPDKEVMASETAPAIDAENQSSFGIEVSQVEKNKGYEQISADISSNPAIKPWEYQELLGRGLDVDRSKEKGSRFYNEQAAKDFKEADISHVRIRIADKPSEELLKRLDKQVDDSLKYGIIPIIAYQADDFKNDPSKQNLNYAVQWWATIAQRYQNYSHRLAFDLIIEATDALNKQPDKLNEYHEKIVAEIRKTNPTRILIISPRVRSDPTYLNELKIPTKHNGYLMAEWHFYASGPSKTNERKLWTTGTEQQKKLITDKISLALAWQKKTGVPTWVGAWMPGNYNEGNDYSVPEQVAFASFMCQALGNAKIPFAVNSDTKFYDRETNTWIKEMQPVFDCIFAK